MELDTDCIDATRKTTKRGRDNLAGPCSNVEEPHQTWGRQNIEKGKVGRIGSRRVNKKKKRKEKMPGRERKGGEGLVCAGTSWHACQEHPTSGLLSLKWILLDD